MKRIISAIESNFSYARFTNLKSCGFSIDRVIAIPNMLSQISPKADWTMSRDMQSVWIYEK